MIGYASHERYCYKEVLSDTIYERQDDSLVVYGHTLRDNSRRELLTCHYLQTMAIGLDDRSIINCWQGRLCLLVDWFIADKGDTCGAFILLVLYWLDSHPPCRPKAMYKQESARWIVSLLNSQESGQIVGVICLLFRRTYGVWVDLSE